MMEKGLPFPTDTLLELNVGLISALPVVGTFIYLLLFPVILPILLGLLLTWGSWKSILKGYAAWVGLFLLFILLSAGSLGETLLFSVIYAFIFAPIGVPFFAVMFKLWSVFRNYFKKERNDDE